MYPQDEFNNPVTEEPITPTEKNVMVDIVKEEPIHPIPTPQAPTCSSDFEVQHTHILLPVIRNKNRNPNCDCCCACV
jgi:hypothetical protein